MGPGQATGRPAQSPASRRCGRRQAVNRVSLRKVDTIINRARSIKGEVVTRAFEAYHDKTWPLEFLAFRVEPAGVGRRNRCSLERLKDAELGRTISLEEPAQRIASGNQRLPDLLAIGLPNGIEQPVLARASGADA